MLCDDLVSDPVLPQLYDGMDKFLLKIRHARKFILTKEFAEAADGLVENMEELRKVVPMCCVPFPLTWIEFLHDDRPHWNPNGPHHARPVDPARFQGSPQRVGFLLEQKDDAKRWEAHLFWKLRTIPAKAVGDTHHNASVMMIEFNADASLNQPDPLFAAMKPTLARFGERLIGMLLEKKRDVAQKMLEFAQEDWGGEYRFIVAILGLLNARNVVELQRVDMEPVNRKRAKSGKRQLFTHDLIKVRPFIIKRAESAGDGEPRDLRFHFVRGHFKHRRSGLFFWRMHARGDARFGVVLKDYEIEGK